MKLYMIWGQRNQRYPGEYGVELIDAWSEYVVDDNPEGWAEAVAEAVADKQWEVVRMIETVLDEQALLKVMQQNPIISNSGVN